MIREHEAPAESTNGELGAAVARLNSAGASGSLVGET